MASDHDGDHEHELEAEYLSPSDATVLEIEDEDGGLRLEVVLPCPTCNEPVRASAPVESVVDADVELPVDDSIYD
ncbi:hypothetical protein [Halopiger goleimassiliensis]|uniref:hypothetical protein n=1 Tax=Halopiger goleimassiliensis TaxID=1293048 RepID=UPI000677DC4F|nr:hypothetical protein [Halopiger goleimassiliensis]